MEKDYYLKSGEKRSGANAAKTALRPVAALVEYAMAVYALVIAYYLFRGPFEIDLSDYPFFGGQVKIVVGDLKNPLIILGAATAIRAALGPWVFSIVAMLEGAVVRVLTVTAAAAALYVVLADFAPSWYLVAERGAKIRAREAAVEKASRMIPRDAKTLASAGAYFGWLSGRPGVDDLYVYDYAQPDPAEYEFVALDTLVGEFLKEKVARGLLMNERFCLALDEGGVAVFRRAGGSEPYDDKCLRMAHEYHSREFFTFPGYRSSGAIGRKRRDVFSTYMETRAADAGESGYLVYGQYISLPESGYSVVFRLKLLEAVKQGEVATIDVVADKGARVLAERRLSPDDFPGVGRWAEFELPFDVPGGWADDVEMRVFLSGSAGVSVDEIKIVSPLQAFASLKDAAGRSVVNAGDELEEEVQVSGGESADQAGEAL